MGFTCARCGKEVRGFTHKCDPACPVCGTPCLYCKKRSHKKKLCEHWFAYPDAMDHFTRERFGPFKTDTAYCIKCGMARSEKVGDKK